MKKRFKIEKKETVIPVDYARVVKYDEDGNELITFEPIDYSQHIQSLGNANDWSIRSLTKAGIDPGFMIKTGMNTRLDGFNEVERATNYLDEILASENNEEKSE